MSQKVIVELIDLSAIREEGVGFTYSPQIQALIEEGYAVKQLFSEVVNLGYAHPSHVVITALLDKVV